jgi:uncharacterized repeat protein (TIGR04138 family)
VPASPSTPEPVAERGPPDGRLVSSGPGDLVRNGTHFGRMTDVQFADEVLDRAPGAHPRFHAKAYSSCCQALQVVMEGLDATSAHLGRELARGVRDLALERFGPDGADRAGALGYPLHRRRGRVVFAMVERGSDQAGRGPARGLRDIFDFEEAFDRTIPGYAQPDRGERRDRSRHGSARPRAPRPDSFSRPWEGFTWWETRFPPV